MCDLKYFQKRLPLLIYHACLDPFSKFKVSPFAEEPIFHVGVFVMDLGNISCNLFLFRYLENKRENNIGNIHCDKKHFFHTVSNLQPFPQLIWRRRGWGISFLQSLVSMACSSLVSIWSYSSCVLNIRC